MQNYKLRAIEFHSFEAHIGIPLETIFVCSSFYVSFDQMFVVFVLRYLNIR